MNIAYSNIFDVEIQDDASGQQLSQAVAQSNVSSDFVEANSDVVKLNSDVSGENSAVVEANTAVVKLNKDDVIEENSAVVEVNGDVVVDNVGGRERDSTSKNTQLLRD